MPIKLNSEQQREVIDNIKRQGKENSVDYLLAIRSIEKMLNEREGMSGYDVSQTDFSDIQGVEYNLEGYAGKMPGQVLNEVLEKDESIQMSENNKNLDYFINELNKSGVSPYRAKKENKDSLNWGFYKDVDRYELARKADGKPVYLKYYNDGTYDEVDEKAFGVQKYYNYMPDELKPMMAQHIEEQSLPGDQLMKMQDYMARYEMDRQKRIDK